MKNKFIFILSFSLLFLFAQTTMSQKSQRILKDARHVVVTNDDSSKVDWTTQYVEATGKSIIDTVTWKNPIQARMMAERGAIVDAQRNLLEMIKGINVTAETTVENFMTKSDKVATKLDGTLRLAEMVGDFEYKNGYVQVTMQAPLYQEYGIADAIDDEIPKNKDQVLKPDIVINPNDTSQIYIMNVEGGVNDPVLFPKIFDADGNLVLDYRNLYDPKNGTLPNIVNLGEEELKKLQEDAKTTVIDVIEDGKGRFKAKTKKVNWQGIINVASTVGKFVMMFL